MRISDWSSDVCSSDLSPSGHEELCPESASPLWRCVSLTDRNQSYRPVCRPPGTGRSICPAPLRTSHPDASSDQSHAATTSAAASPSPARTAHPDNNHLYHQLLTHHWKTFPLKQVTQYT